MSTIIIIAFILVIVLACIFLAWRDDKIGDLEKRVEILEQQANKKIVSRLFFVELKSVNSVLDTLNNCFYQIDENGDYDIDTEYRLDDVTDEWGDSLSINDLEVVNKMKNAKPQIWAHHLQRFRKMGWLNLDLRRTASQLMQPLSKTTNCCV